MVLIKQMMDLIEIDYNEVNFSPLDELMGIVRCAIDDKFIISYHIK